MPYDSQGNFTRVMNWQEDAANAVPIVASRHDDEDDNFAQGFNDCYCRDGRAPATGNFKMGSYKITGLGNGTTDNDAVNKSQLDTKAGLSANNTFTGSTIFSLNVNQVYSAEGYKGFYSQCTGITKGTAPTTNTGISIASQDSTSMSGSTGRTAEVVLKYKTNGSTEACLVAYKPEQSSTITSSMGIIYPASGDPYTYAPTPAISDDSDKIATTEWVNNSELPDWTAKISITPDYTFSEKGFLLAWQYTISGQAAYLNGQVILESEGGHDYLGANYNTIFIPVDVGDKLTGTVTGAIFMPCKGA